MKFVLEHGGKTTPPMTGDHASSAFSRTRNWLLPAIAVLAALGIAASHSNVEVFLYFNRLGLWTGDTVWQLVTVLGDGAVVLALALLFARRRPDIVWALVCAFVLSALYARACKMGLDVKRPPALLPLGRLHVIGPPYRENSFPSGHVLAAFAAAGVVSLLTRRALIAGLLVGAASLVGLSRMAVGVHWPIDVLGGAAGGWIAAALAVHWSAKWPWGLTRIPQAIAATLFAVCAMVLVAGYNTGYPAAGEWLRAIGLFALAGFALAFWRTATPVN